MLEAIRLKSHQQTQQPTHDQTEQGWHQQMYTRVVENPGDLSPTQKSARNLEARIAGEIIFPREEHISWLSNSKWVSPESTYI